MPSFAYTLFTFLSLAVLVLADEASDAGGHNALGYVPSNAPAIIFSLIYLFIGIMMFVAMKRYGGVWFIVVPIGAFFMAGGLAARIPFASNPTSLGLYMAWNTPVVLSPCAFIAGAYVVLGRLAQHLHAGEYLFIRPQRIATIFIWSDVITFLIQASGGGMSATGDPDKAKLGANIFLGGLILQGISFLLFCALLFVFLWNISRQAPELWNLAQRHGTPRSLDWRVLAAALVISCIGILIRSGYRIIEMSQGYGGALSKNETLFYLFDTFPLAVAIGLFVHCWPQKFFSNGPSPDDGAKIPTGKYAEV